MKTISYKGAVYVEAAHKKCPAGKHWNDLSHSCQSLGQKFHSSHKKVKVMQAHANKLSKSAKDSASHKAAGVAHAKAWQGLSSLHHHLRENGFSQTADGLKKELSHHDKKATFHHERAI